MSAPLITITVDDDVLTALQELLRRLPKAYLQKYSRRTAGIRRDMQNALQQEPGDPDEHIRWTSLAQEHYFWAVIAPRYTVGGEYQGYPRSHALSQGWKVDFTAADGVATITATNNDPARPYVEGDWQQGFHADTGWLYDAEVFRQYQELLTDVAIDTWVNWSEE